MHRWLGSARTAFTFVPCFAALARWYFFWSFYWVGLGTSALVPSTPLWTGRSCLTVLDSDEAFHSLSNCTTDHYESHKITLSNGGSYLWCREHSACLELWGVSPVSLQVDQTFRNRLYNSHKPLNINPGLSNKTGQLYFVCLLHTSYWYFTSCWISFLMLYDICGGV
jgi:hypothetical protein